MSRGKTLGEFIGVRCQPDLIDGIDRWRQKQADLPSRPEAIRRLAAATLQILDKYPDHNAVGAVKQVQEP
jgi:hypothetical protein